MVRELKIVNFFVVTLMILGICIFNDCSYVHASSIQNLEKQIDNQIGFFQTKGYINDDIIDEWNRNNLNLEKSKRKFCKDKVENNLENDEIEVILDEMTKLTNDKIYKVVDLNDTQQVTFYDNGYFVLDELESKRLAAVKGVNYVTAENSTKFYALKDSLNIRVAYVKIGAKFSYGDGRADVEEIKNFEYNTIPFITVDDAETGSESFDGGAGARAYNRGALVASGAYKFISGNIYRQPFDVRVSVTSDGKVWKSK